METHTLLVGMSIGIISLDKQFGSILQLVTNFFGCYWHIWQSGEAYTLHIIIFKWMKYIEILKALKYSY